ncbi:carboxymuconolactone decarboxylase family protein, partial [Tsukamurella paurometabola]|nr:carboxymuconolactone decarboxylase family protein [Tsukamurella paurometabola]
FERIFDGSGWDERSAALLDVVTELVDEKAVTDESWARLAAFYDERRLVEIVMLATNYDGLATAIDVLGIQPEKP